VADVTMPRLSDSMEEGTILKWLKAPGDEVKRGDELVEIETDKATMTYEAADSGVLEIVAQEGETLPIGEVIARIGEGGSANGKSAAAQEAEAAGKAALEPEPAANTAAEPAQAPETAAETPAPAPVSAAQDGERVKASPVARRLAREHGVELSGLAGSGPGGRIVKADVEAAAARPAATPARQPTAAPALERPGVPRKTGVSGTFGGQGGAEAAGTAKGEASIQELSRTQQVVARRMAEAKATIPHFTLSTDIDMEGCVALREQLKTLAGDAPVPSYNDMIVKASALALRDHPRANGSYKDGHFELYSRVNVGVAVAAHDALVVPTVFDADTKALGEIARETRALAERVRAGAITPPEVSGGTFTVSNLGMYGITNFTAIINPPQAAILAVGAVTPRPVVRDGEVAPRHVMAVTLGCDHRILYGADAANFLGRIRELLEAPMALTL
jgi:pyruvate dehydrogenase E2 component (dihydrolipoamide acetyltransferase)